MLLALKIIVYIICVFVYLTYYNSLEKKKDKNLVVKVTLATFILLILPNYALFISTSWQNFLSFSFFSLSFVLIIILGHLWYKKRHLHK